MPTLISAPTRIQAAGNKPKLIREYVGRASSKTAAASVAHMESPGGWVEPGQTPALDACRNETEALQVVVLPFR